MESDTKRVIKVSDKPQLVTPNQLIYQQQSNQQQAIPVNIQQAYLQPNQVIIPQLQNSVTQPIIYQPLYNQPVIIKPGQPNVIANNQPVSVIENPQIFGKRRVRMICPYCKNYIRTNVELECNYFRCCMFFACILLIICFAGSGSCDCKGSDCCCCCCCCCSKRKEEEDDQPDGVCTCFDDATHICPICNQVVGESKKC